MTSTITSEQVEELPQINLAEFLACETPNLSADEPINGTRVA